MIFQDFQGKASDNSQTRASAPPVHPGKRYWLRIRKNSRFQSSTPLKESTLPSPHASRFLYRSDHQKEILPHPLWSQTWCSSPKESFLPDQKEKAFYLFFLYQRPHIPLSFHLKLFIVMYTLFELSLPSSHTDFTKPNA